MELIPLTTFNRNDLLQNKKPPTGAPAKQPRAWGAPKETPETQGLDNRQLLDLQTKTMSGMLIPFNTSSHFISDRSTFVNIINIL